MLKIMLFIFELLGTAAFAVSGAMVAMQKKMDVFGIAILGLSTAVGGGMIRDIILGITPPDFFKNPVYGLSAIAISLFVFIPGIQKLLNKKQHMFEHILLVMDSLGLAVFTVLGIYTAIVKCGSDNIYLLVFVGVVSGIGGGVLRDVFAGDTPYIFVKHFYATASLIGAVVTVLLWRLTGETPAVIIGILLIFLLRLCAAHFRWKLPKIKEDNPFLD